MNGQASPESAVAPIQDAGKIPIQVLIVDDSALTRRVFAKIVEDDPQLRLFGGVANPFLAAARMRNGLPDVILMDIEMPGMSGLDFLKRIMTQHPLPVVICSSLVGRGGETGFAALRYGAVDVVPKPRLVARGDFSAFAADLAHRLKTAADARVRPLDLTHLERERKLPADAVLAKSYRKITAPSAGGIIVIGASTGGTEAIELILSSLPAAFPPIAIAQHMPAVFTRQFADRLNQICELEVLEAKDNMPLRPGRALIAPGDRHLLIERRNGGYQAKVIGGEFVNRHRPSVDVLFRSASQVAGNDAIGVILTGMGDDGANGIAELRQTGAWTIAQDEASCVVFGMPKEAIRRGGVAEILPLSSIPEALLAYRNADGKNFYKKHIAKH